MKAQREAARQENRDDDGARPARTNERRQAEAMRRHSSNHRWSKSRLPRLDGRTSLTHGKRTEIRHGQAEPQKTTR